MRLVVTGAAGFIGSHLCEALLDGGNTVVGVDAFRPTYNRARREDNLARLLRCATFRLEEVDLLSADIRGLLDGCDAVFHIAGRPGVRDSFDAFDLYVDDNIRATQRLLEAMLATNVRRLVYSSSSSVYGELGGRDPARETDPNRPLSPYGVTKLAAENLTRAYRDNFGIEAVALRYFTIYGPRQRPDMAIQTFVEAGIRGVPVQIFGDGSQRRDVTYIADCVRATLTGLEIAPGVYNVAGGSVVSLNEMLDAIEVALGSELMRTYTRAARGDVSKTAADTSKLRSTGFAALTSLDEGIGHQVEHARKRAEHGVLAL